MSNAKERAWMTYIKYQADKHRAWAKEERKEAYATEDPGLRAYHLKEVFGHLVAADALDRMSDVFRDCTAQQIADMMKEENA